MAAKKSEAKDGEKKKSPLKLVVILLVVLLVAGAGYIFMSRGSAAPAPAPAAAVAAAPVVVGAVIRLDPLFINLKEERFLKLGIALQTSLLGKDPELDGSKALDAAIEVFSGQDIQQLSDEAGRSLLKEELLEQITDAYGSEVSDIYFTEFVMQ